MILSFLTMYRSAKKSTFITFKDSPPHPCCLQLAEQETSVQTWFRRTRRVYLTPPAMPPKSDQIKLNEVTVTI